MGGNIAWSDPIVTVPTAIGVTWSVRIIKPAERLTYAPAVELKYLDEIAELDQVELTTMYLLLRCMELKSMGDSVGGGIKQKMSWRS